MPIILCLDPGTAHTGVAISREGILSEPLTTVFERKPSSLMARLTPIIVSTNPEKIVIGVPPHGPLRTLSETLKEKLSEIFAGEIVFFDEDLSSRKARQYLYESKKSLEKRKSHEHQTAAAAILQEYLDQVVRE